MPESKVPVAVFAYNRPERLKALLDGLSRCDELGRCTIHIFCDGPRMEKDRGAVEDTRQTARNWIRSRSAQLVESRENQGLFRAITRGVSGLCDQAGRVIVLEDDLLVGKGFLRFMLAALDRYADCERVWQVSGHMFPVEQTGGTDAHLLPLTTTWGWATWQRAWKRFDISVPGASAHLQDAAWRKRFDLAGAYPYSEMLSRRLAGRNQSWGVLFYWTVFQANGLVLHPSRSLVAHTGIDGASTHHAVSGSANGAECPTDSLPERIVWPEVMMADGSALDRVAEYLRDNNRRLRVRSWVGGMACRLRDFVTGR